MIRQTFLSAATCAILVSCVGHPTYSPPLGAQTVHLQRVVGAPHYTVTNLETLGGSFSQANGVNNHGDVAGFSRTGDDFTCCDAVIWHHGTIQNLGDAGFVGSLVDENNPINDRDEVTGWVDIGTPDPNGENFCGVTPPAICLPFVYRQGAIHVLPVPSGYNAVANAINDNGEIAGMGEHGTVDNTCPPPQLLHFAAAKWESNGAVRQLPAVAGDLDASAAGINDKGDVSGASGNCTLQPVRAVIWHDGVPHVLPNLGGTGFNIAFAINNKGEAAGQSNLPGDLTHHAALWRNGGVTDLGTLYGLDVSLANGINNSTQVVGFSQDDQGNNTVAMLWQKGALYDLNQLIPPNSGLFLIEALGVNDRGQIAGYAFDFAANDVHGFLATPVNDKASVASQATARSVPLQLLTPTQRQTIHDWLMQHPDRRFWPRTAKMHR